MNKQTGTILIIGAILIVAYMLLKKPKSSKIIGEIQVKNVDWDNGLITASVGGKEFTFSVSDPQSKIAQVPGDKVKFVTPDNTLAPKFRLVGTLDNPIDKIPKLTEEVWFNFKTKKVSKNFEEV